MPPLVLPGGVLIRLIWNQSGAAAAVNVLGAQNTGSVTISQTLANTVGAAIKAAVASSGLAPHLSTTWALANVGLRDINAPSQVEYLDTGAVVAGTGVTDPLPPQTALCVTLRTGLAGRSYRGRIYLPGYVEAANTATGVILASTVTDSVAFVNAIRTALSNNGLTLAVLSRPRDAKAPVTIPGTEAYAGAVTPVTTVLSRNVTWETQRRRTIPGI